MKIRVYEKCNPFSHKPGIRCLIPGTKEIIEAFPAKINDEVLTVRGPMKEWTVYQNLEQGNIQIRGIDQNGYFTKDFGGKQLSSKPKLTFGVHKAQQMERICERAAPEEFLPFWFALGQYYPAADLKSLGDSLLGDLITTDKLHLYQAWKNLFHAGFEGWLIPRLKDEGHHGFSKDPVAGGDPHILLSAGALLIRDMLVRTPDANTVQILPKLPPELHCGRLLDLDIPGVGTLSIEWSKKEIKKMILMPSCTKELVIQHSKKIESFRLSSINGTSRQTIEKPLKIEKDQVIFFDQFHH